MSTNDDDDGVYTVKTVPPPSGGDAYSAPTKVGPMTTALVEEMLHAATQKAELKRQSAAATARHPRIAGAPAPIVRPRLPPAIDRNEPPEIEPPPPPLAQPAPTPPAFAMPAPVVAAPEPVAPVARATPRRRIVILRLALAAAVVTIVACALGLAMYIAVARGWHLRLR